MWLNDLSSDVLGYKLSEDWGYSAQRYSSEIFGLLFGPGIVLGFVVSPGIFFRL